MSPGRGQYDRQLSPAARAAHQRAALLRATSELLTRLAPGELSVARIVEQAGAGRNSFYLHFRDVEQAVRAVEAAVIRAASRDVDAALGRARAPGERLRALAEAWLDFADQEPDAMNVLLSTGHRPRSSRVPTLTQVLQGQLARVLSAAHEDGATSLEPRGCRLAAASGAVEGLLRRHAETHGARAETVSTLVDVVLRAFR